MSETIIQDATSTHADSFVDDDFDFTIETVDAMPIEIVSSAGHNTFSARCN